MKKKHTAQVLPTPKATEIAEARRRTAIRRDLAAILLKQCALGEFDDPCGVATIADRNYVTALCDDLARKLQEA